MWLAEFKASKARIMLEIHEIRKDIAETLKECREIDRRMEDRYAMVDEKCGHLREVPAGIDEERWLLSRKRSDERVVRKINEAKRYRGEDEVDLIDQRRYKKARR